MKDAVVIKVTDIYREIIDTSGEFPILMRHYFEPNTIYIHVDENFAKANGFNSLAELYDAEPTFKAAPWVDADFLGRGEILAVILHEQANIRSID